MNATKLKDHLKTHKNVYIVGGAGLLVGASTVLIFTRSNPEIAQRINQVAIGYKNNQVLVNLIERSTPSKPVHLVGSNLYFESLSEAARQTGHSLSKISNQINGRPADLRGDVFTLLDTKV